MKIEVRYSWRYKWGGRTVTSRIKMTRERVLKEHPEAQLVEGSAEEFLILDQVCEIDAHSIAMCKRAGGLTFLSQLHRPKTIPYERETVPLPFAPEIYEVETDGEVWTVRSTGEYSKEVYRGRGPVRVERTP